MTKKRERLLTIAAAAHIVGRSAATLRLWEQSGKLVPERDSSGRRLYRESTVRALALALPERPHRAGRDTDGASVGGHRTGAGAVPAPSSS